MTFFFKLAVTFFFKLAVTVFLKVAVTVLLLAGGDSQSLLLPVCGDDGQMQNPYLPVSHKRSRSALSGSPNGDDMAPEKYGRKESDSQEVKSERDHGASKLKMAEHEREAFKYGFYSLITFCKQYFIWGRR